jgi:hypothetical protein
MNHNFPYRPLAVLIKPTSSRCNLNCGYCFYLRKAELYPWSDHPTMTLETYEAFVRQYVEGFLPPYGFNWQGGEPTMMGLDFYRGGVHELDSDEWHVAERRLGEFLHAESVARGRQHRRAAGVARRSARRLVRPADA